MPQGRAAAAATGARAPLVLLPILAHVGNQLCLGCLEAWDAAAAAALAGLAAAVVAAAGQVDLLVAAVPPATPAPAALPALVHVRILRPPGQLV